MGEREVVWHPTVDATSGAFTFMACLAGSLVLVVYVSRVRWRWTATRVTSVTGTDVTAKQARQSAVVGAFSLVREATPPSLFADFFQRRQDYLTVLGLSHTHATQDAFQKMHLDVREDLRDVSIALY